MISIIIPAYNAEKTIKRCIDSILKQTYTNFEIVCVNDGSKDKTKQLLDEYAAKNSKVKVFHNENHGVSFSRNFALDKVSGDYVMFLDSDDWLEKKALEMIALNLYSSDAKGILCFNHYNDNLKSCEKSGRGKEKIVAKNTKEINRALQQIAPQFIWDKVFSAKLLKELKLRFDVDMSYGEDTIFLCRYLKKIEEIIILTDYLHHYFRDDSGASLSVKYVPNIEKICGTIFKEQKDIVSKYSGFEKTLSGESYRGKLVWRVVMNNYNPNSGRGKKERINNMKNYKKEGWLDYIVEEWEDKTPLGKVFVILYKLGNFNLMDWALWNWKKIKGTR